MPLALILLLAQTVQLTLLIPIIFIPGINKFLSFVSDMLAYAFVFFLNSILALDPAHLKPRGLTAHLDRVSLVENVIWVRYPYTALNEIRSGLREVAENLNEALEELENAIPLSSALLVLTRSRITYLNANINLCLENYYGFDVSNRTKRGLIDGIGQLS